MDFYLTVLPPKTECVVFSIDGSFTASVSIMGKDPKVRAGAVDIVRFVTVLLVRFSEVPKKNKQKKTIKPHTEIKHRCTYNKIMETNLYD